MNRQPDFEDIFSYNNIIYLRRENGKSILEYACEFGQIEVVHFCIAVKLGQIKVVQT